MQGGLAMKPQVKKMAKVLVANHNFFELLKKIDEQFKNWAISACNIFPQECILFFVSQCILNAQHVIR